ncbi:MAG: ABC transporter substrate-binding protein [Candidatus Kapabacteria bacterium]|nr:ABC transporter substrate-binding protein [Candidatus Kapabacteria bacterium]
MQIGWTLIILSCAILLGACRRHSPAAAQYRCAAEPVIGDVVFFHLLSDPEGLNPYTSNDNTASTLNRLVFDALLEQNPETLELEPSVARSLPTISPDHLQYTFILRNDVWFSDGVPLRARDVVFSFKAVKNPFILEAAALRNYYDDIADVRAPDDTTVIITMTKPYFLALYFLGDLRILPKHILDPEHLTDQYTFAELNNPSVATRNPAIERFARWFSRAELRREARYLIGSGPYVFREWSTGKRIVLVRNQRPWNTPLWWRRAFPSAVVGVVINDRTAAISALKTEEVDFVDAIPPALYDEQLDTARLTYLRKGKYQQSIYTYIGWNLRKPIFQDRRVRQALSYLADRRTWLSVVLRGYGQLVNGPIYRNRPEYDTTLPSYEYNPSRALALLAQAGWKDRNGDGILDNIIGGKTVNFEFSISFNAGNEIRENIAILYATELRKYGIVCTVQKLEWSVFLRQLSAHQFDAYIGAWVNDNIPSDPYQLWHSSQADYGSNYVGFRNHDVDSLLERNRIEFDPLVRMQLMQDFQRIVHREAPYTFLWTPEILTAYNRRLCNVRFYTVRPPYVIPNWYIPAHLHKHIVQ